MTLSGLTYMLGNVRIYRASSPEQDRKYLKFIRRFPCIGCGATRFIEAMHTGPRGIGQKASDKDALPGCSKCHRTGPNALHRIGPVKFQERHKVDFAALRTVFQSFYAEETGRKTA